MKNLFLPVYLCLVVFASAQATTPTLSTSDRIALQALEEKKQEAQKTIQQANQAELSIVREWQAAHPGFHLNENTLAVEKDATAETPAVKK